jgi:hypothetical protein
VTLREQIAEDYPDLLVLEPDYFDAAIIGLAQRIGMDVICYDKEKVLELLCVKEEMTYEDAIEHFEYNIIGSWVGDTTPVFLSYTQAE